MAEELEVITCEDAAAWEGWLAANHGRAEGVWLMIAKKGSGVASVTNDEAVDAGLCWGWISGHRKALDGAYFLQRYTLRRPGSSWSAVNVAKAEASSPPGVCDHPVWLRSMPRRPTGGGSEPAAEV